MLLEDKHAVIDRAAGPVGSAVAEAFARQGGTSASPAGPVG
jgi:hypothetical protein